MDLVDNSSFGLKTKTKPKLKPHLKPNLNSSAPQEARVNKFVFLLHRKRFMFTTKTKVEI